jgi:hypothetical protein
MSASKNPPTTTPNPANRRIFSRVDWLAQGRLAWPDGEAQVGIVDLSLTGAKIQLPGDDTAFPAIGSLVELRIGLADETEASGEASDEEAPEALVMSARIVHHLPDSCDFGLTWTEIDLDSLSHLRRLVELNLGDTDRLHQELEHLVYK